MTSHDISHQLARYVELKTIEVFGENYTATANRGDLQSFQKGIWRCLLDILMVHQPVAELEQVFGPQLRAVAKAATLPVSINKQETNEA